MGNNIFKPTPQQLYTEVESYAKIYPNLTKLITYKKPIMVQNKGFETGVVVPIEFDGHTYYEKQKPVSKRGSGGSSIQVQADSFRRTKTRLSDIVIANEFDLFCTFTFATERQDIRRCKARMSSWLNNQYKRQGKFKYLIVPEFHKDGVSIHFHALFQGYKGELVDSGHKRKDGRIVYNIPGWRFGFSTATKIDTEGLPLVSSYVKKYITKDMPKIDNKKRYWCSHNLVRPKKVANPIIFPEDAKKFTETYGNDDYDIQIAHERVDLVDRNAAKSAAPNWYSKA
jgi:hypothetical protein